MKSGKDLPILSVLSFKGVPNCFYQCKNVMFLLRGGDTVHSTHILFNSNYNSVFMNNGEIKRTHKLKLQLSFFPI